jgi:putative SOS response-associated peptidase YedK
MCYSAMIEADYAKFLRVTDSDMAIKDFVRIYWARQESQIRIPKALDSWFGKVATSDEREIQTLISQFNSDQATKLEQEVFAQKKRLGDAERKLQVKETKAATENKRIATDKIDRALGRLTDIKRKESKPKDARIFPGWYAPVVVMEEGKRVVKPMRYQCRPEGKPAFYDTKYPGTYNARKDNLEGFWKAQFGVTHGVTVVSSFFENVSRHRVEQRELAPGEKDENVVLEFKPTLPHDMLIACLWSKWTGNDGEELLSFAAITDDPPAEIALAGHDRCIIPIKSENVDAWLRCESADLSAYYNILNDRERPYYEYRMAA